MRSRHLIVLPCILAGLALWPAAVRADCNTTSELRMCAVPGGASYRDTYYYFSTPAHRESTAACVTCQLNVNPTCEGTPRSPLEVVQFDIPAGVVYARTYVFDLYAVGPVGAASQDQYWITGPASATPITCTARFEVGGYGNCFATGTASMTVQGHTRSASFDNALTIGPCDQTPPISGALTRAVSASVGQPFGVSLSAQVTRAPQYGSAYVYGLLSFRDLPPGYAIVSCNGFGATTPTVPHTWGSVKSRYR